MISKNCMLDQDLTTLNNTHAERFVQTENLKY